MAMRRRSGRGKGVIEAVGRGVGEVNTIIIIIVEIMWGLLLTIQLVVLSSQE